MALKPTEKTAGEFVAESLEEEANKLPDSQKERADILREAARIYRERGSKRKVRVWEEGEGEDFMKPDPATQR